MNLHVHLGTEKTGSSFVQTVSSRGREKLASDGFFFPEGFQRHEKRMFAGLVSAGNGYPIAKELTEGSSGQLEPLLKTAHALATRNSCNEVVLSSELFLAPLSARETLQKLREIAARVGYTNLRLLLVLRDPVSQFLSLYKHRARHGHAGSIAAWAEAGYDLPQKLAGLRHGIYDLGIDLTVRKYDRGEGILEKVFFTDWLGVTPPKVSVPASVNPSLALSELALLRLLADRRPDLVVPLYEHLLRLDLSAKLQGEALEAHAKAVATEAVSRHADEWRAWNALLPEGEELVIPSLPTEIPPEPWELGFSMVQMDELMAFLSHSATPRFLAQQFFATRVRPILGRAKRAVIGSDLR
jgi:hypothetical protein